MSTKSNLETSTSLKPSNNESLLEKKNLKKIKNNLLNLQKIEVASFNPLKVKVYKDEKEEQKDETKIKIPSTFKSYSEDYKKNKGFINKNESGFIISSNVNSVQTEQIESSDLVNSEWKFVFVLGIVNFKILAILL